MNMIIVIRHGIHENVFEVNKLAIYFLFDFFKVVLARKSLAANLTS